MRARTNQDRHANGRDGLKEQRERQDRQIEIALSRFDSRGESARLPVDLLKAETDALGIAGAAGRIDNEPSACCERGKDLGAAVGDGPRADAKRRRETERILGRNDMGDARVAEDVRELGGTEKSRQWTTVLPAIQAASWATAQSVPLAPRRPTT